MGKKFEFFDEMSDAEVEMCKGNVILAVLFLKKMGACDAYISS